jgi:hypothetical protein
MSDDYLFKVYTSKFGVVVVKAKDWVVRDGGIYFFNENAAGKVFVDAFAHGEWWRVQMVYKGEFTNV